MKTLFLLFCIFVVESQAYSQLCPGSLGDPILNETFGQGHAAAVPLPPNVNSYSFTGGCPDRKGQYTINNFIFGCGAGTWQQTIGDHTKDVDGNYLMVNAESTPGNVYVTTVNNICPNTTYQFAVWVMNVLKPTACGGNPVHPNLTLTVETTSGTKIASYNTGYILETDNKEWKQFGVCFTTAASVNAVVLKITTTPLANGCGSAFMIDDITLKASGPSIKITLDNDSSDVDVCSGYKNAFIFQGNYSSGFTDPVVQWQNSMDSGKNWTDIPGANTLIYHVPKFNSGTIKYRMIVVERGNFNSLLCRIASKPIQVTVHLLPNQQANRLVTGCSGIAFQLVDTSFASTYNLKYHWSGPSGFQSDLQAPTIPALQFSDSGKYIVRLTTDFGCSQTDTLTLSVITGSQVNIQPAVSSICEGQSVHFTTSGDGQYLWKPSAGLSSDHVAQPIASPRDSIVYSVTLTNPSGCKSFAQVVVNVYKSPFANAGPDKSILKGDSVTLEGTVSGSQIDYFWLPAANISDDKNIRPVVYPPVTTEYSLYAVSKVGCGKAISKTLVKVFKDIYIPTAFSPNNDGRNDLFNILAPSTFVISTFGIYDRKGVLLYKGEKNSISWNGYYKGQPQPAGIYLYLLEMTGPGNRKISRKGTFLLIR